MEGAKKEWKDIEYFDDSWKERIRFMSKYIPHSKSVMDIGCGRMWLREMIPTSIYIPVDYKKRDNNTIICDLNKYEFPNQTADVIFISGCLEYVKDYEWFITEISKHSQKCIVSYCAFDDECDIAVRKSRTWVNNLTKKELIKEFSKNGMETIVKTKFDRVNLF